MLFINATRSNGELQSGFTLIPSSHLWENWKNLRNGTLPVWNGMINSLIVSSLSAVLSVYFSTMTAYAIHAYDFKLKNIYLSVYPDDYDDPDTGNGNWIYQTCFSMKLEDSFHSSDRTGNCRSGYVFHMKQLMESTLPSLIEAARIDGSGEFHTFNTIVMPLMKPAIAVQMIFTFVSSWNNYFTPALVLHEDRKKTLPILIAQLRGADWLKFDMG